MTILDRFHCTPLYLLQGHSEGGDIILLHYLSSLAAHCVRRMASTFPTAEIPQWQHPTLRQYPWIQRLFWQVWLQPRPQPSDCTCIPVSCNEIRSHFSDAWGLEEAGCQKQHYGRRVSRVFVCCAGVSVCLNRLSWH